MSERSEEKESIVVHIASNRRFYELHNWYEGCSDIFCEDEKGNLIYAIEGLTREQAEMLMSDLQAGMDMFEFTYD